VKYEEAIKQTIDCKVCGTKEVRPNLMRDGSLWYLSDDSARQRDAGVCPTCDFWLEKWRMRDSSTVVRANGQHYMFGNVLTNYELNSADTLEDIVKNWKTTNNGMGMGGAKIIIRFNDGRVVITNDFWHQGQIPATFKPVLPDNAELEWVS
jgi:hypothetical protein